MALTEDYNEQTHVAAVPWKKIFMPYEEDKISLDAKAASKNGDSDDEQSDLMRTL